MLDRIPTYPNRVLVTPENGSAYYATITRADDPVEAGTPLNKATLLSNSTATKLGLDDVTATVSQALAGIATNYNITLLADSWSTNAPYTQTVSINGILDTDNPIVDIVLSSNNETANRELESYAYISKVETGSENVTVYCFEDVPSINLNLQLKVVR